MRLSGPALLGPRRQLEQQTAFLKFFKKHFISFLWVFCLHMCICTICMPGVSDSLGLEFLMDVGPVQTLGT